eukprot:453360-Pelagomonas_calceolata.AAC.5
MCTYTQACTCSCVSLRPTCGCLHAALGRLCLPPAGLVCSSGPPAAPTPNAAVGTPGPRPLPLLAA